MNFDHSTTKMLGCPRFFLTGCPHRKKGRQKYQRMLGVLIKASRLLATRLYWPKMAVKMASALRFMWYPKIKVVLFF